MEVGIDKVIAAARDLGIDAPLSESPSLALGSSEVSLLDLTGAYASVRAGRRRWSRGASWRFRPTSSARCSASARRCAPKPSCAPYQRRRSSGCCNWSSSAEPAGRRARRLCGRQDRHEPELSRRLVHRLQRGAGRRRLGRQRRRDADGRGDGRQAAGADLAEFHDRRAGRSAENPAKAEAVTASTEEETPVSCDVRACSRAYRSFRAEDCTFQPYSGPRRLCER